MSELSFEVLAPSPLDLPAAAALASAAATASIPAELLARARTLETRGIAAAEATDLDLAHTLLTECVDLAPTYASAYNNRAAVRQMQEARRMQQGALPVTSAPVAASALQSSSALPLASEVPAASDAAASSPLLLALGDCDAAIRLAQGDRSILRQAHTQRALIAKALGRPADEVLADFQLGGMQLAERRGARSADAPCVRGGRHTRMRAYHHALLVS
jgi:hypothetical protein